MDNVHITDAEKGIRFLIKKHAKFMDDKSATCPSYVDAQEGKNARALHRAAVQASKAGHVLHDEYSWL